MVGHRELVTLCGKVIAVGTVGTPGITG